MGGVFISMDVIAIIGSIVTLCTSSIATCCNMTPEKGKFHSRNGAIAFLIIGMISMIGLWAGTDAAAEYNCSGEMTCDYYSSVGCDDDKRDYVSCYNPDVTSSRRRLTGSKEALEDVEVFRTLMEHKDLMDFPSMAKIVKEKQTKIIEERRRLDESDEDDSSCGKACDDDYYDDEDDEDDWDGKIYYSKWGDDCPHAGGTDDTCRGWTEIRDCREYCNPLRAVACDSGGCSTIESNVVAVAGIGFAIIMINWISALVVVLAAVKCSSCCKDDGTQAVPTSVPASMVEMQQPVQATGVVVSAAPGKVTTM